MRKIIINTSFNFVQVIKSMLGLLLLIAAFSLTAQEYQVKSFNIDQEDLSARLNPRMDNNGRKCGLVRIQVPDKIVEIQGAVIGGIEENGLEKNVYLSHDCRQIRILFENHTPLDINFLDYGIPVITEQKCYVLCLNDVSPTEVVPSPSAQLPTPVSHRNEINGHEYVDLGLPSGLKWATMNVGATSPEDYGSYFAWGETQPKEEYTESNNRTFDRNYGDIGGNAEFDAARANWGGSWRLPTKDECDELLQQCIWINTKIGNHKGYKVIGPNGNYIFLPAASYRYGPLHCYPDAVGDYYTSSPGSSSHYASELYFLFIEDRRGTYDCHRFYGQSVRPVSE